MSVEMRALTSPKTTRLLPSCSFAPITRCSRISDFPRAVGITIQLSKVSQNSFPGHHDERDPRRMELMPSKTPTSPLARNNSIVARISFFEELLCAFSILRTLSYRIIAVFAFYGEFAVTFGSFRAWESSRDSVVCAQCATSTKNFNYRKLHGEIGRTYRHEDQ